MGPLPSFPVVYHLAEDKAPKCTAYNHLYVKLLIGRSYCHMVSSATMIDDPTYVVNHSRDLVTERNGATLSDEE